jgi:hypothetical protein
MIIRLHCYIVSSVPLSHSRSWGNSGAMSALVSLTKSRTRNIPRFDPTPVMYSGSYSGDKTMSGSWSYLWSGHSQSWREPLF